MEETITCDINFNLGDAVKLEKVLLPNETISVACGPKLTNDFPSICPYLQEEGCSRTVVEHSYARQTSQVSLDAIKGDDPLKIYPEDLDIKTEAKDEKKVIIKNELDNDADEVYGSEKFNHQHGEKTTMEVATMDWCESVASSFILDDVGLNNCRVEGCYDSICASDMPKHVLQETQKIHEVTIVPTKTEMWASEEQKKNFTIADVRSLEYQLTRWRNKEQELNPILDKGLHKAANGKNTILLLQSHIDYLLKHSQACHVYISNLKQTIQNKDDIIESQSQKKNNVGDDGLETLTNLRSSRESQRRELEKTCDILYQSIVDGNAKLASQQKELKTLKEDIDITNTAIIDSLNTREALKGRLTHIQKGLEDVNERIVLCLRLQQAQDTLKFKNKCLEETQLELKAEKKKADFNKKCLVETQLQLEAEKRKTEYYLVKEQTRRKDHVSKMRESDVQVKALLSTMTLKKTIRMKVKERRKAVEEYAKLQRELKRKKKEAA